MTFLVALSQEKPTRLLISYLNSRGIPAHYQAREGEHAHGILLENEAQLSDARSEVEEFISNPAAGKYQQAAWQSGEVTQTGGQRWFTLREDALDVRRAPFTFAILFACIITYALMNFGWFFPITRALQMHMPLEVWQSGEWWRILGPSLLHFSAVHIVFNLLWWWMLGRQIEAKFGTFTLVLLFLLANVLANTGQVLESGPNFGGMSGVVYAVVGFVWWLGWLKPAWGLSLPPHLVGLLLVWLILGYMDVLWVSMANTAHSLGLVSGCLFAWVLVKMAERAVRRGPNHPDKDTW